MTKKEETILTTYTDARCNDYLYYNTIFTNNTGKIAPIIINDRRSTLMIDDGLKYRYTGTLKRFLIDSFLIPLTRLDPPAAFVITFRYNNIDYPQPVVYVPSNDGSRAELQYAVFTIEQWVECLNQTLELCYAAAVIGGLPATFAPFFILQNDHLYLVADTVNYFPSNPIGCQIYVSSNIFVRLGGSCSYLFKVNNSPKDAILEVKSLYSNYVQSGTYYSTTNPPVAIAFDSFAMPFSDSALDSVTTINQILIQAVATEIKPQLYGTNLITESVSPNNLSLQTIEDFVFVPDGRGKILYEPTVERPFNMLSDRPISQFSFNVMYMDNDLTTYQAFCIGGSTSSFKFGFVKEYDENLIGILLTTYRLLEKFAKKFQVL